MKFKPIFKQYLGCSNAAEVFQYLERTLTDSITLWDYFVNWGKVIKNVRELEIDLNTLNYLVGKDNIEEEFKYLIRKQPDLLRLIPILLACRDTDFSILIDYIGGNLTYKKFSFKPSGFLISDEEIDDAYEFTKYTGLLDLFKNKIIKSVPDYVIGVEVGLDSNARKNRSGTTMETIVGEILDSICQSNKLKFLSQVNAKDIKKKWGLDVRVDKSNRRFDFAINNSGTLYLLETNYYGDIGSKLKSTAGEYITVYDLLKSQGHRFIWITDGLGWRKTLHPLEETFNHIDYILNINMVVTGLLAEILCQKL